MVTETTRLRYKAPLIILVLSWLAIPVAAAIVESIVDGFFSPYILAALGLLWIVFGVISALWSVRCFFRRAWMPGVLTLVLPVAILTAGARSAVTLHAQIKQMNFSPIEFGLSSAVYATSTLLLPARYVGDIAHFIVVKPSYDARVAKMPADGNRFEEFNWGGWLFFSSGVVYDETDEIARPAERRSPSWVARFKDTDLMCGGKDLVADVRGLWSHYYLAGFGC